MNESTENSLRQFERIERQLATATVATTTAPDARAEPEHQRQQHCGGGQAAAAEERAEEEEHEAEDEENRAPPPITSRQRQQQQKASKGGSDEPAAETEEEDTEKVSAAGFRTIARGHHIFSPQPNFNRQRWPLNSPPASTLSSSSSSAAAAASASPMLHSTPISDTGFSAGTITPSSDSKLFHGRSTAKTPLKVPNFKQADVLSPPTQRLPPPAQPIFQSTPHHQNVLPPMIGAAKRWPSQFPPLHTPGGRPVSPITEEDSQQRSPNNIDAAAADLSRLVSNVEAKLGNAREGIGGGAASNGNSDKMASALVTQLRDLIAQWDWAQARHRHVAKIYFDRQQEELNAGWENLQTEMARFKQEKQDEWQKIAALRSSLQSDRAKVGAKKDAERTKELELEVEKLKAKELLGSQKMSELRTKIRELEGEVRVREASYLEHMTKIRKTEQQLVRAEQENSNLRTKLTLMRAAERQAGTTSAQQQQATTSGSGAQQPSAAAGSRATTLFNHLHPQQQRQQPQDLCRLTSTSSSTGGTASTASAPDFGNVFQRRHNSTADNGAPPPPQQRMQRSNSENGTAFQSRPRVRFADEQQISAPPFLPASPTIGEESMALNRRFDLPADMLNTMYRMTARGREYTFINNQRQRTMLVTELLGCRQLGGQCLLYEYPLADGNGAKDFRWISGPLVHGAATGRSPHAGTGSGAHGERHQQVKIEYRHVDALYKLYTPRGNHIRFLLTGQLEICWASGDRTLVLPDGERREIFSPTKPDFRMEIYSPTGIAYRLDASTQWQRQDFVPDTCCMAPRPDGSYSTMIGGAFHKAPDALADVSSPAVGAEDLVSLQINGPDFKLRRFNGTRAAKIAIDNPAAADGDENGGSSLQLWLCVDNVLLVKHMQRESSNNNTAGGGGGSDSQDQPITVAAAGGRQREKRICFSHGQCRHIRMSSSSGGGAGSSNPPVFTLD